MVSWLECMSGSFGCSLVNLPEIYLGDQSSSSHAVTCSAKGPCSSLATFGLLAHLRARW